MTRSGLRTQAIARPAPPDTIHDFHHGFDKIDVTAIDAYTANPNTAGDQAFAWGGTTATVHGVWYTERRR